MFRYRRHPAIKWASFLLAEVMIFLACSTPETLAGAGPYLVTQSSESSTSSLSSLNVTNTYDLFGNRVNKIKTVNNVTETTTYQYNPNDQLLTETSAIEDDTTYGYNDNGSMISKVSQNATYSYQYSLRNRLSDVTVNRMEGIKTVEIDAHYVYNQGGMRVKSTSTRKIDGVESNIDRIFLLDSGLTGYQQILEELTSSGSVTKSYTLGDDVLSQTSSGTTRYLSYDGHGSTRLLTDGSSAITERFDYDAYGNKLGDEVNQTNPVGTDLLYTGEQFDPELGDIYLRSRYYSAKSGGFNRLDEFMGSRSDPQSLHKYAYCMQNPIDLIDPAGYSPLDALVALEVAQQNRLALPNWSPNVPAKWNPFGKRFPFVGWAAGPLTGPAIGYPLLTLNGIFNAKDKKTIGKYADLIEKGATELIQATIGEAWDLLKGMTYGRGQATITVIGYYQDDGKEGTLFFGLLSNFAVPNQSPYVGVNYGVEQENRAEVVKDLVWFDGKLVLRPGQTNSSLQWAARNHDWILAKRNNLVWTGRFAEADLGLIHEAWMGPLPEPGPVAVGQVLRLIGTPFFYLKSLVDPR